MKRISVLLLVTVLSPVYAGSFVWKVSQGDRYIYLGGTVHVLSESDYPLPREFDQAFAGADQVIFETDIGQMQSIEYQALILQALTYPQGESLDQKISSRTFNRLKEHLQKRGLPIEGMLAYKPGMIMSALVMLELQYIGANGTGVDQYYFSRAMTEQKKTGKLESIEEQIGFLAKLGIGQEDAFINYTLDDLENLPILFNLVKSNWRTGETKNFAEEMIAPLKSQFPEYYDLLMVKRNRAWLPEIEAMFQSSEVELVLVGALHLVGQDGLLEMLKARGYRVKQL